MEEGEAPEQLTTSAVDRPDVPWPGRTRPLCVWPEVPIYDGKVRQASSFIFR